MNQRKKITPEKVDVVIKNLPYSRYVKMKESLSKDGISCTAYQSNFYQTPKKSIKHESHGNI